MILRIYNKSMELEVKLLNVNYKANSHVKWLDKSKTLHDYSKLIKLVRDNISSGLNRDESIEEAIKKSIKDGILKEYLMQRGSEVHNMLLKEFDLFVDNSFNTTKCGN